MMVQVAIIGVGRVGAALAYCLLDRKLVDRLILVDIDQARAEGTALDLLSAFPSAKIAVGSARAASQANIIVLTAGFSMGTAGVKTRGQLLERNKELLKQIMTDLKPRLGSIIIVVTNPVDVLTKYVWRASGLKPARVLGFGGSLDAARLRYLLIKEGIEKPGPCYVIGEHGEGMLPVFEAEVDRGKIVKELRNFAQTIITKAGGTQFGPAKGIADLIATIVQDKKEVLCVCNRHPTYGWITWPFEIGRGGTLGFHKLDLDPDEQRELEEVAKRLKSA